MIYTKIDEKQITEWLKNNLSEERFIHSLGTAECAKMLAAKYGLDKDKAYTAGLLHDCAKCFPKEELLSMIKENKIPVENSELINSKTLHAPVSAYVAQKEFGVVDPEVLSSIRWHTIGKIDMSVFEKIIFLADKIEPNTRDKDYSEKIANLLNMQDGLDRAILECYKGTIVSLVERNLQISLPTIEIYNRLQNKFSS